MTDRGEYQWNKNGNCCGNCIQYPPPTIKEFIETLQKLDQDKYITIWHYDNWLEEYETEAPIVEEYKGAYRIVVEI